MLTTSDLRNTIHLVRIGINHFKNVKGMAQYTAAKNVPNPELAVEASGALLLFGGASILLGLKP
jgi:uncharacterized membrane protein YphA (DoxX/SURF4 family)